jgi:hypothetical protein
MEHIYLKIETKKPEILRSPAFRKYSVIRKGTVLNDLIGVFHSSTGWLALSLPTELPSNDRNKFLCQRSSFRRSIYDAFSVARLK